MKSSTSFRSSALWLVFANCAAGFVISSLSEPIASSKAGRSKLVGGGFGGGDGKSGGGPSRVALASAAASSPSASPLSSSPASSPSPLPSSSSPSSGGSSA